MIKGKMVFFFAGLLCLSMQVFSQKSYFVYLQTEDNTPFFVQLNKKNYSSSAVGHVILSGLTNGTYNIQVGYPDQNTLQDYQLVVENKDQGFLVKKVEGNFGIVNLQNETIQWSGAKKREAEEAEKQKAFELAESKRIENEKIMAEAQKKEDEKAGAFAAAEAKRIADEKLAADAKSTENVQVAGAAVGATTVSAQSNGSEKEGAQKTEDSKKKEGTSEKSVSEENKKSSTGTAIIAGAATVAVVELSDNKKEEKADSLETTASSTKQGETSVVSPVMNPSGSVAVAGTLTPAEIAALQEEARRIDAAGKRDSVLAVEKAKSSNTSAAPVFLDMTISMPGDSAASKNDDSSAARLAALAAAATIDVKDNSSAAKVQVLPSGDSLVVVRDGGSPANAKNTISATNPNCKAEATDADVELVSMIIKGEKDPEDALEILKKTVKVKCITTGQLRTLTTLFSTDEHRYTLLDLAYRYTSDRHNYASLGNLLTDAYYLNRFKAMLQ